MRKLKRSIKRILILTLSIVFVVGIGWIVTASLFPPDKEKMEKCFQQDRDDLNVIADYLSNLEYSYVSIDESNVESGVMFTGAYTFYQKIDDKTVLKSLKRLLNNKNYTAIGKNGNTVFFEKWNFLQKERGIAVSVNKKEPPSVEFLIKSEPLSEIGWYYYEADYEEYRNRY